MNGSKNAVDKWSKNLKNGDFSVSGKINTALEKVLGLDDNIDYVRLTDDIKFFDASVKINGEVATSDYTSLARTYATYHRRNKLIEIEISGEMPTIATYTTPLERLERLASQKLAQLAIYAPKQVGEVQSQINNAVSSVKQLVGKVDTYLATAGSLTSTMKDWKGNNATSNSYPHIMIEKLQSLAQSSPILSDISFYGFKFKDTKFQLMYWMPSISIEKGMYTKIPYSIKLKEYRESAEIKFLPAGVIAKFNGIFAATMAKVEAAKKQSQGKLRSLAKKGYNAYIKK